MSEVIPFVGNGSVVSKLPSEVGVTVNQDLVDTLEELLAQARTGELQAAGFAVVRANRARATSWEVVRDSGYCAFLAHAIMGLHYRFSKETFGDD